MNPRVTRSLQQLKNQLFGPDKDIEGLKALWQADSQTWSQKLRPLIIKHRNIDRNWQFSEQQKELLKKYYYANKLLVDCLNSASNVTPAVRQEIEDTLLLPVAEIEKRRNNS
jgi:predicted NACHT family NTPase